MRGTLSLEQCEIFRVCLEIFPLRNRHIVRVPAVGAVPWSIERIVRNVVHQIRSAGGTIFNSGNFPIRTVAGNRDAFQRKHRNALRARNKKTGICEFFKENRDRLYGTENE